MSDYLDLLQEYSERTLEYQKESFNFAVLITTFTTAVATAFTIPLLEKGNQDTCTWWALAFLFTSYMATIALPVFDRRVGPDVMTIIREHELSTPQNPNEVKKSILVGTMASMEKNKRVIKNLQIIIALQCLAATLATLFSGISLVHG